MKLTFLHVAVMMPCWLLPAMAQTPLRVAAAADLEPVLPSILEQFQRETGIRAEATYQASAALAAQIQNGAPFDVFLSADLGYPQKLIAAGLAQGLGDGTAGTPIIYGRGTLVLWTRKDTHLPVPSMEMLLRPEVKRIAIANPERAPYGQAAVAVLHKRGLYDKVKSELIFAENIAQAAQFVDSGNADVGFISLTSATTPKLIADGRYFVIPSEFYPRISQGIVLIAATKQRVEAKKLLVFLMSTPVQQEMRKFGLTPGRDVPDVP